MQGFVRLWEDSARICETLGEDSQGFTRICKDLRDFGRGFARICEIFGRGFGFARLWERICKTLEGFVRLWERICTDFGFGRIRKDS